MTRKVLCAIIIFIGALGVYFFLPESCPEAAKRTAFIFVLAAFFWAFEIMPLYATSLLVVLLETFLLARPGGVLDMDRLGYVQFFTPFSSPVIILFFGGFIIAAVMRKYGIDRFVASRLMRLFGHKPYAIMLGFMITTAFLSMWMSNTATTAMMLGMITPLLFKLDADDRFKTALALSIAFSANIGGIGTPVGTPPNAIAIGILTQNGIYLNFLSWMMMAVPLVIVLLFVTSFVLRIFFPPKNKTIKFNIEFDGKLDRSSYLAIGVILFTILMWLSSGWHKIPESMVALLAVGFFAAIRLIDRSDLKHIDWDILVLMWGGLALGKALEVSGLTQWIVSLPIFVSSSGFMLIAIFCLFAVVLSTVMSNTATANLLIPIVISFSGESPIMLAVTVALCCGFAMALPISTPPNAMTFATDVVKSKDMLKSGALVSLISVVLVLVGFKFFITKAFGLD